jgi:hypothetical protein
MSRDAGHEPTLVQRMTLYRIDPTGGAWKRAIANEEKNLRKAKANGQG